MWVIKTSLYFGVRARIRAKGHGDHNNKRLKPIFRCNAKPFTLGPCVGLDPQLHNFALGIQTCWYLKMLKFALPPTPNLKFALPPTQTPNASQWNIGPQYGSPTQNLLALALYISFFLCRFHSRWVLFFSGIYALK